MKTHGQILTSSLGFIFECNICDADTIDDTYNDCMNSLEEHMLLAHGESQPTFDDLVSLARKGDVYRDGKIISWHI